LRPPPSPTRENAGRLHTPTVCRSRSRARSQSRSASSRIARPRGRCSDAEVHPGTAAEGEVQRRHNDDARRPGWGPHRYRPRARDVSRRRRRARSRRTARARSSIRSDARDGVSEAVRTGLGRAQSGGLARRRARSPPRDRRR